MRPPYPVAIPPLLPQFLTRARTGLAHVQRVIDELGIDRPAFLIAVNLVQLGDAGATEREIAGPYAIRTDHVVPALAAARAAGLVEPRDDRWHLTPKGRDHAVRLRAAAHDLFAARPNDDGIARLADLLERAFEASLAAPEPPRKDRVHRALRGRISEAALPFARLEDAIRGLWLFRDDSHIHAWRAEGFEGPALDALTRIWRGEAGSAEALAPDRPRGREDVDALLARLRRDGLVAEGEPLRLTDRGRAIREAIERETDRAFFSPWPEEVGAEAGWIEERLAQVNERLAT